ncbi:hypothetical protein CROQUDRAFT_534813 [Cronartium quercuum f. sp. fusiforme G11]|uniref:Uncharacterized protein n=1 Tax=Cronartium quercuum f. sp. fusiforme G11 TaxID=708437 RepID=A0A9P6NIE6_9BASI|nr:hypothetical protein CROQUDRAFT_534813 [Cronartium quercuum f. sp. fusiforme G11]
MLKQLHAHIEPRLLDMAAITLSTASLALVTPACILDPIIPAAQIQLNTTTHKDGWITSMHVEPQEKQTGPNSLILGLNSSYLTSLGLAMTTTALTMQLKSQ